MCSKETVGQHVYLKTMDPLKNMNLPLEVKEEEINDRIPVVRTLHNEDQIKLKLLGINIQPI